MINRKPAAEFPVWGCTQQHFYKNDVDFEVPLIERAQGIYMWDVEGNRYIDASSGPICSNIGHANFQVAQAMYSQALKLDFAYPRVTRTVENISFTERVARLAGVGFERVFMTSGGSEAVDIALKFARQYKYANGETERNRVFSLMPSYHGMTLGTLAISGDMTFEPVFRDMAFFSKKAPAPITYRKTNTQSTVEIELQCADELDRGIRECGPDRVLAFVVEPVGGLATGCLAPGEQYFNAVRRICTEHGVVLIHDEIMSGAGRTGRFLTSHRWPDARPDLVVLGKGIGAGYVPLGMMLAPATWVDPLRETTGFNYAHTANASPLACAVGNAVLDVIEDQNMIENARVTGKYLRSQLELIKQRHFAIGDIRGRGMLLALEICHKGTTHQWPLEFKTLDRVRFIGLKHGLILYARQNNMGRFGDWLMITPPLIITRSQCDDYLDRIEQTIEEFEAEVTAAGLL